MKVLQEITEWNDNTPNNIYIVSDNKSKLLAYIKVGSTEVNKFKVPIEFSVTRRKFKELQETFGFKDEVSNNPRWEVKSQSGSVYVVEQVDNKYMCSCLGFKFRGNCKHLEGFTL